MKKLFLLTGLTVGFTAVAGIRNADLKAKFKNFIEREKVSNHSAQGYIDCDEINSLSEQELAYMKDKAVLMAYSDLTSPFGKYGKLREMRHADRGIQHLEEFRTVIAAPLRLYNNIIYCQSMKNKA